MDPSERAPGALAVPVPDALLDVARAARKVVEVGAGRAFGTALAFKAAAPRADVVVTDVNPVVRDAPAPLAAVVDDVTAPAWHVYEGAGLVYGIRLPEELQVPAARVARRVGAAFAVRPLKDEWADVSDDYPRVERLPDGWRLYRHPRG